MRQQEKNKEADKETGLIEEAKLNEVIYHVTTRPNKTLRIQQDFQNCPTLAEQHEAHTTDINYLIARYKPDELAAYIAARGAHKREIMGHDFTMEPNLQEAKNITYKLKQNFEALSPEIKNNFRNHVEFLKFVDNPANAEKLIKLGLITKKQVQEITTTTNPNDETTKTETSTKKESKN